MRKVVLILILVLLVAIGTQLFGFHKQRKETAAKLSTIEGELRAMEEENRKLQADISYYANPDNLEKELRARFNYKSPGEELIIVVPKR
ncbi:MAG: septum formation initiator family protein [bacterium]|nr:septum formation initiator family protein [bacterium]